MMILNTIYKRGSSGSIRVWWAEIGEGPLEGHWRTVSGLLDGEKVVTEWKFATPKSQFNAQEQAIFEATSAMTKKLKIDHKISIESIDEKRKSFIKPMLANDYVGWPGPCFTQPKLDGMRCIANKDGLWSRLNNRIISVPHIEASLKDFFRYCPEVIIDGELYNHDLHDDFNMIMSLTKKTIPTTEDLARSKRLIQFWIFDMYNEENPNLVFEDRWKFLQTNLFEEYPNEHLVKVPTTKILTEQDLNLDFIKLLEHGFEGQMVRLNSIYEQKRTSVLLKRKEYVDEEFELLDIEEGQGNWSGYAKIAICSMPNGKTFGAGISGTQEFNFQLLKEKEKYKSVTIKYFQLTPDGVPRFPIAIKFHEELFDGLKEHIKPAKDLFG